MNKYEAISIATDYIIDNGWCQGSFQKDDGSVCFIGAMTRGLPWSDFENTHGLVQEICEDARKIVGESVMGWNDRHGRTFEEVLDLFHTLAINAKEELN